MAAGQEWRQNDEGQVRAAKHVSGISRDASHKAFFLLTVRSIEI